MIWSFKRLFQSFRSILSVDITYVVTLLITNRRLSVSLHKALTIFVYLLTWISYAYLTQIGTTLWSKFCVINQPENQSLSSVDLWIRWPIHGHVVINSLLITMRESQTEFRVHAPELWKANIISSKAISLETIDEIYSVLIHLQTVVLLENVLDKNV